MSESSSVTYTNSPKSPSITRTPYQLAPQTKAMLAAIAHASCFRCHGTGVARWRRSGTAVDVCKCVQQRLPAMQEVLEKQKAAIEADLAAVKAEATNDQNGEPQAVAPSPAGEEAGEAR